MSGFAGELRRDGGGAGAGALASAASALSRRWLETPPITRAGGFACVGQMIHTEPGLVLVADARLYNRAELSASLCLDASVSDGALIVSAYRKWGEGLAARVIGDFAFVIWDRERDLLFGARDHVGVRPFYYANSVQRFVFGSEQRAIRAFGAGGDIDDAYVADFLAGVIYDTEATAYSGVARLPPAHTLRLSRGELTTERYWRPSPQPYVRKQEAAALIAETFNACVRSRMSAEAGALLSGGLDSSAIAVTAARMSGSPLRTFSTVFATVRDERAQIDAVLEQGGFDPSFVQGDEHGPFWQFGDLLNEQDGLFHGPGLATTRQAYRAAAQRGVSVLLDGHGGDEVISHGFGRLKELALGGSWLTLWRECAAEAATYGGSQLNVFLAYWNHLGPLRGLNRAAHALTHRVAARARRMVGATTPSPAWQGFINRDFARSTRIQERRSAALAGLLGYKTETQQHIAGLTAPIQAHALEVLNRTAAAAGIEVRFPFWDKRLIEICLALPPDAKLHNGWSRYAFRTAMKDVLPETVRWRRDKFDFTHSLAVAMCNHDRELLDAILYASGSQLEHFIEIGAVRTAYERMKAAPERARGVDVHTVWRSAALALWLDWRKANSGVASHTQDVVHG